MGTPAGGPEPPERRENSADMPAPAAPASSETARVNLNARVRPATRRRVRMYAAARDADMQDVIDNAIVEYLERRNY